MSSEKPGEEARGKAFHSLLACTIKVFWPQGGELLRDHSAMSDHHHPHAGPNTLGRALLLTAGFALVEFIGGLSANSLALIGDAGHMVTDAFALGLAALALAVSRVGSTRRYSYGMQRAEVLGALLNVLLMYAVIAVIAGEAIARLRQPAPVGGMTVMLIAGAGLLVNLLVVRMLHAGPQTLNTRGAMLHVLGDILGSVAALVAGAVVWFTGWTPIDPILSLLICGLILVSSTRLLLESVHIVMEGVPPGIDLHAVGQRLAALDPDIVEVHDLHIWSVSSGLRALSAHVVIKDMQAWPRILRLTQTALGEQFGIEHVTLQPEVSGETRLLHFPQTRA